VSAYLLDFAFVAIMTSQNYKKHLLDQLYNFRQGHMSVQDYITIFKNLTHRGNVREHSSETITSLFGFTA